MTRTESSRYWAGEARRAILADPVRALKLAGVKLLILFDDFEVPDSENYRAYGWVIPLLRVLPTFGWITGVGCVGIVIGCGNWRRNLLPLGFLAMHVAGVLLTYNFGRFRIGMTPLVILFAAHAVVWIAAEWKSRRRLAIGAAAGAGLISAASFLPPPGYAETTYEWDTFRLVGDLGLRGNRPELAVAGYSGALAAHHKTLRQMNLPVPETPEGIAEYRDIVTRQAGAEKGARLIATAADVHARLGTALRLAGADAGSEKGADIPLPGTPDAHFRLALEYDPANVTALFQSGRIAAEQGQFDTAERFFRLLLETNPRHEEGHFAFAEALAAQNRHAEAEAHYRRAIEIEPDYVEARVGLARELARGNRTAEALEHLTRALAIAPDYEPGRELLRQLERRQ